LIIDTKQIPSVL